MLSSELEQPRNQPLAGQQAQVALNLGAHIGWILHADRSSAVSRYSSC
jgi:hypothetical protein